VPDSDCMENMRLSLLRQLFASATYDASVAIRHWTNTSIRLTLDEVCEIPLEDVCSVLNIGEKLLTMVVLYLEGEVGGAMVLCFEEEDGRRLAASLLSGNSSAGGEWTEVEKSALTETGNIVACAYVSAITRLIDKSMIPSVPYFIQDYGASVLQQALVAQAADSDAALICRTGFHHEGEELNWLLLFVPTLALRTAVESALGWSS
jgi:chemotaxis protein CheC